MFFNVVLDTKPLRSFANDPKGMRIGFGIPQPATICFLNLLQSITPFRIGVLIIIIPYSILRHPTELTENPNARPVSFSPENASG